MTADNAAFLQIIDASDTGILILRDVNTLYANPACTQLFGFASALELASLQSALLLLIEEDHARFRQACDSCRDDPQPSRDHLFTGQKKNNSRQKLHIRFQPIAWSGDEAIALTISEAPEPDIVRAAGTTAGSSAMQHSQSQLIKALDGISSAIALFDPDDRLIYCNSFYGRFLDKGDLVQRGLTFTDILHLIVENGAIPEAEANPDAWISKRLHAHRHPSGITEICRSDGTWDSIHEQKTEDGSTLVFMTDITAQKQADEARSQSEAYLKAFVENSPAAVFLKDTDANFIYVNETYREWQNVSNEEIIGSSIYSHFPPEIAARIAEQDRLALEERKSSNVESFTKFPDGVERSVVAIRFPVIDADGEVIGVSGFITDTSDHFRAKEELETRTDLYTSVLDNLPIGVSVKKLDGRYLFANKQLQIWRGRTEDQFLDRTSAELFAEDPAFDKPRRRQEDEVRKTGSIVRREEWRDCDDGKTRFFEWIKFPVFGREGELFGIGTIGTDLTERKAVEQHLRSAKESAEVASRAKSEFLAHMSHELRTPLNAVIGFSQLMVERTFGELGHENYDDYAKDIYAAGNHLLNVISDILDISKIEAGEIELEYSNIDVGQLMASAIKMMRSRADTAGITLALKLPRDPPLFRGDELRMRQILLNLLSNAVKFTRANGRVSLSVAMDPDGAMNWHVSDTGIGIAEEDIARVLKPFEQARQGFQLSHEGTGLGLYLTQTLTELHGGTLSLNSKLGEGTLVSLHFPPERSITPPEE